MAYHKRNTALDELKSILSTVSGVNTVVRTFDGVDITTRTQSELPLIDIQEPSSSIVKEREKSPLRLTTLELTVRVYFLAWADSVTSSYETLLSAIRTKIASNHTLNNKCSYCEVVTISEVKGEMPLYHFDMILNIDIYEKETDL